MQGTDQELIGLERRFWQAILDQDTDTATSMLTEPAVLVTDHGSMQFDHAKYRRLADNPDYGLVSYDLSKLAVTRPSDDVAIVTYEVDQVDRMKDRQERVRMADSSTWVRRDGKWLCAIHTETPMLDAPSPELRT